MRQPLFARIALVLALLMAGSVVLGVQAATPAQTADQSTAPARIAVVHAAPFGLTQEGTTVSVVANAVINGANGPDILLTNTFQFGQSIPYVTVPAGSYRVRIFAGTVNLPIAEGTTPALTQTVNLLANTDYTALAIGRNDSTYPLELRLLNDTFTAASTDTRVRIFHAAPFANTVAQTAVDVRTQAGGDIGVNNVTYGQGTNGFLTLPAGSYDLKIVPAGQPNAAPIIDIPPFTLNAGDAVTAIAIGTGASPFQARVLLLPFQEREPARVRLVHAAPFATGAATVTVALNGQIVTNSLGFRAITPYLDVPAGLYNAQVFPGSLTTVTGASAAITAPLVLQDGQTYTVVAMGSNTPTYPLMLRVLDDDNLAGSSTTANLRVLHAAPFAATVAGTAVDVAVQDGTSVVAGLGGIRYGDLRGPLGLPSGTYDLKITPAGSPTSPPLIDIPPLTLNAGDAFTVIAIGGPNGQTPGVLVLDDLSVTERTFLPLIRR